MSTRSSGTSVATSTIPAVRGVNAGEIAGESFDVVVQLASAINASIAGNFVVLMRPDCSVARPSRGVVRCRSMSLSGGELADDPGRVGIERPSDRQELDHVDAPLAAFVLRDEALRLAELVGELLLRQLRFLARGDEQFDELDMGRRAQRLQDSGFPLKARV